MRRMIERLASRLMPKATGKAARVEGACYTGCGSWGMYLDHSAGRRPGGKPPCC